MSLREAISFLAQSLQIRCLAIMALSQGLATSLIELAWKSHLHMLHPSPSAYAVRMPPSACTLTLTRIRLQLMSTLVLACCLPLVHCHWNDLSAPLSHFSQFLFVTKASHFLAAAFVLTWPHNMR